MNIKTLVFPCGSEIGLELYRALGKIKEVILYGGSSISDHGEFAYENYLPGIPFVDDDQFIATVNRVVAEHQIDYVIPAHDRAILKLAEASQRRELACKVLTSPYETCAICCSKRQTHLKLCSTVKMARLYQSLRDVQEWPVFLKPDSGCGSKGTAKVYNLSEAQYQLARAPDSLILEYLPGREFTIDCFTDRHRRMLFCGGRERVRISNGISVRTVPVDDSRFQNIAESINRLLAFRGMWFIQVKEDKCGHLAVMEVAPRIAGSMGLYRNCGINFALMSLYDAEGCDVGVIRNDFPIIMDRALESRFKNCLIYDHVYVDYDDCIVVRGNLNLQVVMFLYQCVNNGVHITLLTRHARDLESDLQKHRIRELFDNIVNITDGAGKSGFIGEKNAVFIDDSFAERNEVKIATGLPVFAPDAVESLLV